MKNRPDKMHAPQELENDFKELKDLHKNNGHNDFQPGISSVTFNDDKSKVFVSAVITEGLCRRFDATAFAGNTVYTSQDLLHTASRLFNGC